jgi:hypothetical protein
VDPEEAAHARRILPERAVALFESMPVADRRHGLDVAERLLRGGHDDADLLAAALLHDAAKGHRMRLWHRIVAVILEALSPSSLRRLASPDPSSWRHPFHLHLHHEPLSAALCADAGCPPRVGAFIRGEVADPDLPLLRALITADDAG